MNNNPKLATEQQVKEVSDTFAEIINHQGKQIKSLESGVIDAIEPSSPAPNKRGEYKVTKPGIYLNFKDGNGQSISVTEEDYSSGNVSIIYNGTDSRKLIVPITFEGEVKKGDTRGVSGNTIANEKYINELYLLNSILNISTKNAKFDYQNLSEAILSLPMNYRKKGMIITFKNLNSNWETWQYNGDNDANNSNFTRLSNWENKSVNIDHFQPYATKVMPLKNVDLSTLFKITNVSCDTDYSRFANGLKRYYIHLIGRIGSASNYTYRIGVTEFDNTSNNVVGVFQITDAQLEDLEDKVNVKAIVEGRGIKFEILLNITPTFFDNYSNLTYDILGLSDALISSYTTTENNGEIIELKKEEHNASWFKYNAVNKNSFKFEFDINPYTGTNAKFGLNLFGIVDPNFSLANQSIGFNPTREGIEVSVNGVSKKHKVNNDLIIGCVAYIFENGCHLFINGIYIDSYIFDKKRSNSVILFTRSTTDRILNVKQVNDISFYSKKDIIAHHVIATKGIFSDVVKAKGYTDRKFINVKNLTKTECDAKVIELVKGDYNKPNAIYKIPLTIAPKFRLKVEFKPNFDINKGETKYTQIIDTGAIKSDWNVSFDKLFNAYIKSGLPTAKTITTNDVEIPCTIPNYVSGTRVEFGSFGYSNNYVEHTLDGYVNKPMAGDDSFYIRFKGDVNNVENQKIYVTNNGVNLEIRKDGEATALHTFLLTNYTTLQALYIAIKDTLSNYECNFRNLGGYKPSDLLEFEKMYLIQKIPNGNKSSGGGFIPGHHFDNFPVYLPLKDDSWHTLEIFIDNTRPKDRMRATLDGLVKNFVYRDGGITDQEVEGYMYLGGDRNGNVANCEFRNLIVEPYNTEPFTPKVICTIAHHITDDLDGKKHPTQGAYYSSIGSMVRFIDVATRNGWQPITMQQLEGYLYHNLEIPLKSFVMVFDDSIVELLNNMRLRSAFTSRGIKPAIPMITNDLGVENDKLIKGAYGNGWDIMLHDFTHDMYMGCWQSDELATHIQNGLQMMLDRWGILTTHQANNFGWGTPMSSKVLRDNGLNVAFGSFQQTNNMIISKGSNPMYLNRFVIQGDDNYDKIEEVLKYF